MGRFFFFGKKAVLRNWPRRREVSAWVLAAPLEILIARSGMFLQVLPGERFWRSPSWRSSIQLAQEFARAWPL